jgi:MFS transporter, DHA2 family, multidrug resistance protein
VGGRADSTIVLGLLAVTIVGFIAFVIWELTDEHPIVDLRVFRYGPLAISTVLISITFGIFFASLVLIPLWLQTNMGYSATWAGNLTAFNGVLGFFIAPLAARLMTKVDPRALACIGLSGLAIVMGARSLFSSQMTFAQMAPVQLAQGAFMPLFFIPLMAIALNGIAPKDLPNASGLFTFSRTVAGAIGASISTTAWANEAARMRSELAGSLPQGGAQALSQLGAHGLGPGAALGRLDALVQNQAVMLATNQIFALTVPALIVAACIIWLAPKPMPGSGPGAG